MRRFLTLVCLTAAAVAAAGACAATAPPRACGSLSVGPTAIKTAATGRGATCMLSAFRTCSPAVYRLSSFGVDTIGRSTFTIVKHAAGCTVTVAVTFQVVPQPPKAPLVGHCARIVRSGSDIVAAGCRGPNLAVTESLTGRRTG